MKNPVWAILLIVAGMLLITAYINAQGQPVDPPLVCGDRALERRIRELKLTALDDAFKEHVENLFLVRMRDRSAPRDLAFRGVNNGINTYIMARNNMIKWTLPEC